MTGVWKAYCPEGGETAEDAYEVKPRPYGPGIHDAKDAAERACEMDYEDRDGWERGMGQDFFLVVIAPDGTETRWKAWHEPSVTHQVYEADDEE